MMKSLIRTIAIFASITTLMIGLPRFASSFDYDHLVAMASSLDPSVRDRGEIKLEKVIKETILKDELDPGQSTEDTFCFGHFISPTTLDLAIGISTIPYGGYLIILSQKNGHYAPVDPVTGIGHIESIEAVRLFSGELDQLVLNLYSGGSGLRHWAKDIYRWDGEKIRMIWAWVRKEIYAHWPPGPDGKDKGHIIQSDITIGNIREGGTREIITSTAVEKGIFDQIDYWEFESVMSKSVTTLVHVWDQSLYFYLARHGRILPPGVTMTCDEGIPHKKVSITLQENAEIGIVEIPGGFTDDSQGYNAVAGKERFCKIPKSAVELID